MPADDWGRVGDEEVMGVGGRPSDDRGRDGSGPLSIVVDEGWSGWWWWSGGGPSTRWWWIIGVDAGESILGVESSRIRIRSVLRHRQAGEGQGGWIQAERWKHQSGTEPAAEGRRGGRGTLK